MSFRFKYSLHDDSRLRKELALIRREKREKEFLNGTYLHEFWTASAAEINQVLTKAIKENDVTLVSQCVNRLAFFHHHDNGAILFLQSAFTLSPPQSEICNLVRSGINKCNPDFEFKKVKKKKSHAIANITIEHPIEYKKTKVVTEEEKVAAAETTKDTAVLVTVSVVPAKKVTSKKESKQVPTSAPAKKNKPNLFRPPLTRPDSQIRPEINRIIDAYCTEHKIPITESQRTDTVNDLLPFVRKWDGKVTAKELETMIVDNLNYQPAKHTGMLWWSKNEPAALFVDWIKLEFTSALTLR